MAFYFLVFGWELPHLRMYMYKNEWNAYRCGDCSLIFRNDLISPQISLLLDSSFFLCINKCVNGFNPPNKAGPFVHWWKYNPRNSVRSFACHFIFKIAGNQDDAEHYAKKPYEFRERRTLVRILNDFLSVFPGWLIVGTPCTQFTSLSSPSALVMMVHQGKCCAFWRFLRSFVGR